MSQFSHWRVLSRADCSLCATMLHELIALVGTAAAQQIQVVDITADPELERKFGQRLPVLQIQDEVVCCYRLDHDRLRPYL